MLHRIHQAQLQEIKKRQLDTAPQQDKLLSVSILRVVPLTDTLDHLTLRTAAKLLKKSLSTYAISEILYMILIMKYLNLLITTLFTLGQGFVLCLLQKILCQI